MERIREVLYNSDINRIFLKGFLGKIIFEIKPVGDFISFDKTFFLGRLIVSVIRTGEAGIKRDKAYEFLISKKCKQKLLKMLKPTQAISDPYQQYYTMQ